MSENALRQIISSDWPLCKPPYNCLSGKNNEELYALQNITYREDYEKTVCDECDCDLESYCREVADEYEEDWREETICRKDWLKLPKKPTRIRELKNEIMTCKVEEQNAGIIHHTSMSHMWDIQNMFQKVDVPKLYIPEDDHMMGHPTDTRE